MRQNNKSTNNYVGILLAFFAISTLISRKNRKDSGVAWRCAPVRIILRDVADKNVNIETAAVRVLWNIDDSNPLAILFNMVLLEASMGVASGIDGFIDGRLIVGVAGVSRLAILRVSRHNGLIVVGVVGVARLAIVGVSRYNRRIVGVAGIARQAIVGV